MSHAVLSADDMLGHLAEALAEVTGTPVTVIPGGFRVRELAAHHADVMRTEGGWRVACTPKDALAPPGRCWLYEGGGWSDLIGVVRAVTEWDGGDDTEPGGRGPDALPAEPDA